jgi:hypothetical protein
MSVLSGEITAIAIAVLAVGAIVTAVLAYMAFRKQNQEIVLLQQQVQDEAFVRRSGQASRVMFSEGLAMDPDGGEEADISITLTVTNCSDLPIFDVSFLWWRRGEGKVGTWRSVGVIPPGADASREERFKSAVTTGVFFRDAAGLTWRRKSSRG